MMGLGDFSFWNYGMEIGWLFGACRNGKIAY